MKSSSTFIYSIKWAPISALWFFVFAPSPHFYVRLFPSAKDLVRKVDEFWGLPRPRQRHFSLAGEPESGVRVKEISNPYAGAADEYDESSISNHELQLPPGTSRVVVMLDGSQGGGNYLDSPLAQDFQVRVNRGLLCI